MNGSDYCVVVFFNALPMPGYIRGSARQRGRDALTSVPPFSAMNAAPPKSDMDYREKRMSQNFGGESNGVSAASFGPFLNGEAPVLPGFMEARQSDQPTIFAEEFADDPARPFTEVRSNPTIVFLLLVIVILLLAGFIVGWVHYASRGDYYYFKLEIGGRDSN